MLFTLQSKELLIIKTPITTHGLKVQSQRVRMTLFGESPRKNQRIGSSGLNLTYEGLLLGMRAGGHGDSKTEAHPQIQIQMNLRSTMKFSTHLRLFCRIKSSTR
jgi:hypothetical protein